MAARGPEIDWEVLGIYTTKTLAMNRCEHPGDLVVALPLDMDLPDEKCTFGPSEEYPYG